MNVNRIWMDFIIDDIDRMWFVSGENNALFYYEKKEKRLSYEGYFPIEANNAFRLYSSGIKYGNKLVFGPFHANAIAIYNIKKCTFTMFPMENDLAGKVPFCNIFSWNKYIYMIATGEECIILRLDMETYQIKKYKYYIKQLELSIDFMCREVVIINNVLYCAFKSIPTILEFNLEGEFFTEHTISGGEGFGTIASQGNDLWLSEKTRVIKWSCLDHSVEEYREYPENYGMQLFENGQYIGMEKGYQEIYSKWHHPFYRSMVINQKLLLLSAEMNMSLLVDIMTGQMVPCCLCEDEKTLVYNNKKSKGRVSILKYLFINNYGDDLIVYSTRDDELYCINKEFQKIEEINLQLSKEDLWQYWSSGKNIMYENEYEIDLKDWLKEFIKNNKDKVKELVCYETYGKAIYNCLKR